MKHAGKGNSSAQDFAFVAKSVKTCTLSQKNLPIAEGKETVRNSESEEAEVHQPHRKERHAVHIRINDGLPAMGFICRTSVADQGVRGFF